MPVKPLVLDQDLVAGQRSGDLHRAWSVNGMGNGVDTRDMDSIDSNYLRTRYTEGYLKRKGGGASMGEEGGVYVDILLLAVVPGASFRLS